MIVKLETTNVDDCSSNDEAFESWVYFDGFRKVKQIHINKSNVFLYDGSVNEWKEKAEQIEADYYAINSDSEDNIHLLVCSLKYNEESDKKAEYLILTNQQTYLLNDEGKTIERIV